MTLQMPLKCGDKRHFIRIENSGDVVMVNHPSMEMLESFVAFGAKPPRCLNIYKRIKEEPFRYFVFSRTVAPQVHVLSIDFAKHSLQYLSDDDPALRRAHSRAGSDTS